MMIPKNIEIVGITYHVQAYQEMPHKEQGKAVRLSVKKLWHYFIRGGLQGAVFYTDSKIGEHC